MTNLYFKTEPQAVTESLYFFLLEDNPFKKETVKIFTGRPSYPKKNNF
ncbi:MAG: hypothetical protein UT38_C0002G0003 [Microgenomates group bacterium GW2011_GWA2_39_19]|nr:MAG: hypothetical protein UT38_C0002G0003 [Microgenomates group bacterium GW2011_GWA2_39_19]